MRNSRSADERLGTGSIVLDEIAEVIGEDAALDLAWEFYGQKFYVSKVEPRIVKAVGEEAAARFLDVFHGLTMDLPFRLAERRQVLLLADTHTRREIAAKLRLPERQVYRHLKTRAPKPG